MLWRKNHLEENEDIYSDSSVYSDINYGEEKERTGRRGKKKGLKRAGAIVLSAVLFGAVAAGTFQGVNYLTGYGSGDDSQQEVKLIRAASTAGTANETAGGMDVTGIVEEAMPFVVSITNRSVQEVLNYYNSYGYGFMLPQTEETESCGSGIIIGQNDTELLIATNNHVVEDADDLSVSFIDNSVCEANIKGTDADNDLAVIAVPLDSISSDTMSSIAIATMGDSDALQVGEQVVAIGNALGYGQSVTTGIVSALNRTLTTSTDENVSEDSVATYIQTDAAINPGNSGGALLNMQGEVVGINSAKLASTEVEGMGYAIPISRVGDILETLMNQTTKVKVAEENRGSMGVVCTEISERMAQMYNIPQGVFVEEVQSGSAAEEAGITAGSVITALDGTAVTGLEELQNQMEYYSAGDTVEVTVQMLENNTYTEKTVSVTLDETANQSAGSQM